MDGLLNHLEKHSSVRIGIHTHFFNFLNTSKNVLHGLKKKKNYLLYTLLAATLKKEIMFGQIIQLFGLFDAGNRHIV